MNREEWIKWLDFHNLIGMEFPLDGFDCAELANLLRCEDEK
jgi:hypothetical protein